MQRAHLEWVAAVRKHPLGIADLRWVAGTVYFEAAGWFDQRTLKTFEWLLRLGPRSGWQSDPTVARARLHCRAGHTESTAQDSPMPERGVKHLVDFHSADVMLERGVEHAPPWDIAAPSVRVRPRTVSIMRVEPEYHPLDFSSRCAFAPWKPFGSVETPGRLARPLCPHGGIEDGSLLQRATRGMA